MARLKIQIRRIENERHRNTTFMKRRENVKKKAMELAKLCDVETMLVVYGPRGQLVTWPEDADEVRRIMDNYLAVPATDKREQLYDPSSLFESRLLKLEKQLKKERAARLSAADLPDLLRSLDAAMQKIDGEISRAEVEEQERERRERERVALQKVSEISREEVEELERETGERERVAIQKIYSEYTLQNIVSEVTFAEVEELERETREREWVALQKIYSEIFLAEVEEQERETRERMATPVLPAHLSTAALQKTVSEISRAEIEDQERETRERERARRATPVLPVQLTTVAMQKIVSEISHTEIEKQERERRERERAKMELPTIEHQYRYPDFSTVSDPGMGYPMSYAEVEEQERERRERGVRMQLPTVAMQKTVSAISHAEVEEQERETRERERASMDLPAIEHQYRYPDFPTVRDPGMGYPMSYSNIREKMEQFSTDTEPMVPIRMFWPGASSSSMVPIRMLWRVASSSMIPNPISDACREDGGGNPLAFLAGFAGPSNDPFFNL